MQSKEAAHCLGHNEPNTSHILAASIPSNKKRHPKTSSSKIKFNFLVLEDKLWQLWGKGKTDLEYQSKELWWFAIITIISDKFLV